MSQHADVIFAGGAVYTADADGRRMISAAGPDGRPASAVAVTDGRIVAVGSAADSAFTDLTGPRTERVDLRARALLPGFQDAHAHPAFAGVTMIGCNLIGAATLDEALARIGGVRGLAPRQGVDLGQRLADGVVRARHAEQARA
jgi:predicted amidohydrolase YtcJ